MGWPPCMAPECENWPSVGFTGLCKTCIKDPELVASIARQMEESRSRFREQESSDHFLVCWLSREPQVCLELVLEIVKGGETDIRRALEMARSYYWSTFSKRNK